MTVPPQQPPVPPGGWPPPPHQPAGWPPSGGGPGLRPQPVPPQPGAGWPQPVPPQPGAAPVRPGPAGPAPQGPAPWQPPPAPLTKRIPEDQPFLVRQNVTRRALLFGGLLVFMLLVVACPLGAAAAGSGDVGIALVVLAGFTVFFGLLLGFQLWLLASGGPVLAVGPAGLWIKTRPTRGQAIWLPWAAIEQIYRRRWGLEKMLCVKPRDPRTEGNLGAYTAIDSAMQKLFFGTGFTATLTFADRSEEEIMAALAHFSAGRCHLR